MQQKYFFEVSVNEMFTDCIIKHVSELLEKCFGVSANNVDVIIR